MDSYIIQVEPRDELTAVIDKIVNTQAVRVYLLVPENSRVAQSALNFRLIKREADTLGREVIVVSSSAQIQSLALKSALQVHLETSALRAAGANSDQTSPALPKISDVFISSGERKKSVPLAIKKPSEMREIKKPLKPKDAGSALTRFWERSSVPAKIPVSCLPKFFLYLQDICISFSRRLARNLRFLLLVFIGITMMIAGITLYSVLPSAKIYITPLVEEVLLEMRITGNVNVGESQRDTFVIPAQIFEKSLEAEKIVKSSAKKEVRVKAEGVIKIYNSYSSSPQTLIKNTRFVAEDGKLFRTVDDVVVPGAKVENNRIVSSFTTVRVAATEAGEQYNIGPSSFSIPGFKGTDKYLGFYGKSESAMTGGKIGVVKVVSEDDYNIARRGLEEELKLQAENELTLLLPQGMIIPSGGREFGSYKITSTNIVGDIADEFRILGTIIIKAFAVREEEIVEMLADDFIERFPEKKLFVSTSGPIYEISQADFTKGILDMKVSLPKTVYESINPEEIVADVRGKDEENIRKFLGGLKNIKEAKITFWPFWVDKMPSEGGRIKIVIEGV